MNKRGGPPVKLIVIAATLLGCVYLLYLYNSSQGRLREAEASAERYRRSDESKVAQLQDSMKEKELLQEKCENDRQEFVNRLNSLNSQHKMLKGQHDELEAENGRLQQEMQKARDDNANVESQHRQEFSQMKQEKELDIASLRDQIANMQRQNDNLQNEISSLKAQLENSQQNAAAAANALNQVQGNQQQQQNFVQQQNGEQQQQIFAQQQAQAAQQAAQQAVQQAGQINQAGGLQANDLVYQAQGQGQFQGQGQAQGQEAVQNMNQNVNQDINNPNMNAGAQVPNAGQDANNQHQMAAVDLQQGQGQGQGQQGVNNDQHQMQAPNMDAANQEAGNQNQDLQDVRPDMVENQGQIFKPDFNNQGLDNNKLQINAQDNQQGLNNDHDNRILNEGPVNLQVQEPLLPNRNFDEDKHIPQQQLAPGNDLDQAEKEAAPLQPQGHGQMMIPNFGLGKNMGKDGDGVQVEGEGRRKEAPMPHGDM